MGGGGDMAGVAARWGVGREGWGPTGPVIWIGGTGIPLPHPRVGGVTGPLETTQPYCRPQLLLAPRIRAESKEHTISPGRNRVNFQILAYLLTIDLLYGTGCLSY